jgi:hypothetical protein
MSEASRQCRSRPTSKSARPSSRPGASSGAVGRFAGDIVQPLKGRDLCVEANSRAEGFRELYTWLEERDVLIVKAVRREPLIIVRLPVAVEIAELVA